MKRKKPVIAVNRIRAISPLAKNYAAWCRGCNREVELVTFAEAGKIAGVNFDEVIEQAAAGGIHLGIRPEAMLVCVDSLVKANFRPPPENSRAQHAAPFGEISAVADKRRSKQI